MGIVSMKNGKKKFIILKVGGSSLDSFQNRETLYKILNNLTKEYKVILVISAIGRSPYPFSTDSLLENTKNLSLKEIDSYIFIGEIYSEFLLLNEMRNHHIKATCLTNENFPIIGIPPYGNGIIKKVKKRIIEKAFAQHQIVLIPGFQARYKQNKMVTLGRDGTDYTAIMIAKSFKMKRIYLLSSIAGIYPNNPEIIREKHIKILDYDSKLLQEKKVIQKKALAIAKENQIEIIFTSIQEFYKKRSVVKHV